MNQIINMFMRIIISKVMRKGVDKGIDMLSRKDGGEAQTMTKEQRRQMRRNRQQMRQTRQAAKMARKLGKF